MPILHAIVRGTVQGVGYRAFAQANSWALDLRGWVRNLPDGSVEVYAFGSRLALELYIERLHKGPRGAHVTDITVTFTDDVPADQPDLPYPFQIRYDG